MPNAGENHARDMEGNQDQEAIREALVGLADPVYAPELICRHHPACERGPRQQDQESENHRRTRRVVTDVPGLPARRDVTQVTEHGHRTARELSETGVVRSNQTPDDPQANEGGGRITSQMMDVLIAVSG